VARRLTIVYGGIEMGGGSTSYLLDGKYTTFDESTRRTVTWRVVAVGSDEADFLSNCEALEQAFRTRNQGLTITFGPYTHANSGSEGFLEEPKAAKLTEIATTGRSRVYECSVSFRLPASDQSDRVWARVEVSEDESKIRTFIVTGQWTASSSGGSARSNAESKVPTYATDMRPSGTWDEGLLSVTVDSEDKLAEARYEQREIVHNQSEAGLNHAAILRPVVRIERMQPSPGDAPGFGARRRAIITASYSCGVSKAETTDLHGLYVETIRPFLVSEVRRVFQPIGEPALVSEAPGLLHSHNRIDSRLVFEAEIEAAGVYRYQVRQQYRTMTGKILVPQYDGDEAAWTKHVYQGPKRALRVTTATAEGQRDDLTALAAVAILGQVTDRARSDTDPIEGPDADENWILLDYSEDTEPDEIGNPDLGLSIRIYRSTTVVIEEYRRPPLAPGTVGSGGDSGGAVTTGSA